MAITTLDQALAGMQVQTTILKVGVAVEAAGIPHSHFYSIGAPGAAALPAPGVNGAALTTYGGQLPWVNPASGNAYLARLALTANVACSVLLLDRLWHNSALSVTLTSSQAITSPAWPARDKTGTTNGDGIECGIEWSSAGGAGVPAITLGYTNQAGTAGRVGTLTGIAGPNAGTFERFNLQAGDTGIRSIQSYQANATRTSGAFHLVAYRVIAQIGIPAPNISAAIDALTSGFPRLYNDSVLFLVQIPTAVTATTLAGTATMSHG